MLKEAQNVAPEDAIVPYYDGYIKLQLDERMKARDLFEVALSRGGRGGDLGRVGLAYVAELLGEFDTAAAHLDAVETKHEDDLRLRRRRAEIWSLMGREEEEARLLREILSVAPAGDFARWDRYRLAEIAYHAGRIDEALAGYDALAAENLPDAIGTSAERMRTRVREARARDAVPRRHRLENFPTVTQKRSHCGPASIELCLRYFGLTTDQDAIAKVIKLDTGTPTYAMLEYFRQQGYVTRRFEGALEKLKAIIDAGIPVIIEEEYSMSTHVAVVVGYDDAREILYVQDPMTHRIRETFYEGLEKLRGLFNHGAIIGVPQDRADKLALLDQLGVGDSEYIVKAESAWKLLRDRKPEDADRAMDEVFALRDDFEMAWIYRINRAFDALYAGAPDGSERVRAITLLARERFPNEEWPWQYVARFHFHEGRYADALDAYRKAHLHDPADTNNLNFLGECYHRMGKGKEAFETWLKALEMDPGHPRVNENLGGYYLELKKRTEAEHFIEIALAIHWQNPFNHENQGLLRELDGDWEGAIESYNHALRQDGRRVRALTQKGKCLLKLGRQTEALKWLQEAVQVAPKDPWTRVDLADAYLRVGNPEAARKAIEPAYETNPDLAAPNAILGACLFKLGRPAEGEKLLRKALQTNASYAWARTELAWGLLRAGQAKAALVVFEESEKRAPAEVSHTLDVTHALAALGDFDEALGKARQVVERTAFKDPRALRRHGDLAVAAGRPLEGANVYESATARYPGDVELLREYALFLIDHSQHAGAEPWARQALALAPDDAVLKALLGSACFRAKKEEEGERLLSEALAAKKDYEWARRELAGMLAERGRGKEALQLLEHAAELTPYVHYVRMRAHERAAGRGPRRPRPPPTRRRADAIATTSASRRPARAGQPVRACLQAAERLAVLAPTDTWALFMQAFALRKLGRFSESEQALIVAERRGHDREKVLAENFHRSLETKDWARALVAADALRRIAGADGVRHWQVRYGEALLRLGRREDARALLGARARRPRLRRRGARRVRRRGLRFGARVRASRAGDGAAVARRAVLRDDAGAARGPRRGDRGQPQDDRALPGAAPRPREPRQAARARGARRPGGAAGRPGRPDVGGVRERLGRAGVQRFLSGRRAEARADLARADQLDVDSGGVPITRRPCSRISRAMSRARRSSCSRTRWAPGAALPRRAAADSSACAPP